MKIKFFRTIWWKLLLYYFFLIIVTIGIFYVLSIMTFRKFMDMERRMDVESRIDKITGILSTKYKETNNLENLKDDFLELAQIYGMPVRMMDPDGNDVALFRQERHRHDETDKYIVSMSDLNQLREKKKVSRTVNIGKSGQKFFYLAYPIVSDNEYRGFILAFLPMGPPGPPGKLGPMDRMLIDSILIATLVATLVALFMSQSFTKPIRLMEKAARSLAEGDFSHRMKLNRKDELGYLADAFDDMSLRLKKNIESRMKLMGDISHELNTPLTTIQGSAEVLYDGMAKTDEDRKKYLKSILNSVHRLSFLINDITELSKFEAGEVKAEEAAFNVEEPIKKAIESAGFLAKKKNIRIESVIENVDYKATGDPKRILQAIQNLINNAIQHNPPETCIRVSAKKENEKILFTVEDNGTGIPEEELDNIFERFHKVDKARTSGDSGSGLGLAIVKEIMKAHNQDIHVTSSGKGSRFYFYLPST